MTQLLEQRQKNNTNYEEDSIFLARRPFGPPRSENLAIIVAVDPIMCVVRGNDHEENHSREDRWTGTVSIRLVPR